MKFICFGSGSSGNCYYLYTEKSGLMIDSGVGFRALKKHFKDRMIPISHLKHILVTHDHADHVKSVGAMSNEYNLSVYATEKVHFGIKQNYVVRIKPQPENIHIIEKGVTFQLDDFKITPFEVPHDSMDNVGYFIECDGVNFCLMTDMGSVTDEILAFIHKANYLVIEANHDLEMLKNGPYPPFLKQRVASPHGHMNNAECGRILAENLTPVIRHVWLCHLSAENNHPELARKTVDAVLADYGLITGKDFMLEVLKRSTPSQVYDLKV